MISEIGIIGLGTMGENLCIQLSKKGFNVSIYNRTKEKTKKFIEKFSDLKNIHATYTLDDFIKSLEKPRKIILLIKAGKPVDEVIQNLLTKLNKKDIIIDAGNSNFKDTERRFKGVSSNGINFLGIGISGGIEGARKGLSIMAGGSEEGFKNTENIFKEISAEFEHQKCYHYFGKGGVGHFIKTIHNGIEYALIENISEIYYLLLNLNFNNEEISKIFKKWNSSELFSFLMNASLEILKRKENEDFLIELILDKAEQKGTGKWAVEISMEVGIPVPSISMAVFSRSISYLKELRIKYSKIYKLINTKKEKIEIESIKKALELSNILSYIQGINLLKGGKYYGYDINVSDVLRIWRAGSIIRSKILNKIYQESLIFEDILISNYIKEKIHENYNEFKNVIKFMINNALPCFVFSANYNYLIYITKEKLPANLTQALRDYFGGHGYYRKDKQGYFYTDWFSVP